MNPTPNERSLAISALTENRATFDNFIYVKLEDAIAELARRRADSVLRKKVEELLGGDVPEPMRDVTRAVLFRQIATSNYEIRRFFSLIDLAPGLEPLFFEYSTDKFVSNNEEKHAWGKLFFYAGHGKKGGAKIESTNIIDFNTANGKRLADVKTLWGQPLVDFHHELFATRYREAKDLFFDASDWFSRQGGNAGSYYRSFLSLFLCNGILFENFLLDEKGVGFTRDVVLPAIKEIEEITGVRPLIVNTEPTELEGERFWMCHPHKDREYVLEKLSATLKSEVAE